MGDRPASAPDRVGAAAEARLGLRHRRSEGPREGAEPPRSTEGREARAPLQADVGEAIGEGEDVLDLAVQIELAEHPGATQPELVGLTQQLGERVRALDQDSEPWR